MEFFVKIVVLKYHYLPHLSSSDATLTSLQKIYVAENRDHILCYQIYRVWHHPNHHPFAFKSKTKAVVIWVPHPVIFLDSELFEIPNHSNSLYAIYAGIVIGVICTYHTYLLHNIYAYITIAINNTIIYVGMTFLYI